MNKMYECIDMMKLNQQTLKKGLENEPYCTFGHSSGALYSTIIIHLSKFGAEMTDMIEFAKFFFAEENVMIFPGTFFAGEVDFIRLVISCDIKIIEEFLVRFKRFCHKHLKL
jgi:aspartate/methionine/tyrosine aminotransferase